MTNIRQLMCHQPNKLSKYRWNPFQWKCGKPKGARNKKILAIESLLEGKAEALTQTAISKALEGDGLALRLCLEGVAPALKDKSVTFPLPEMTDAMDASRAASSVLTAASEGELNPIEGITCYGAYR